MLVIESGSVIPARLNKGVRSRTCPPLRKAPTVLAGMLISSVSAPTKSDSCSSAKVFDSPLTTASAGATIGPIAPTSSPLTGVLAASRIGLRLA